MFWLVLLRVLYILTVPRNVVKDSDETWSYGLDGNLGDNKNCEDGRDQTTTIFERPYATMACLMARNEISLQGYHMFSWPPELILYYVADRWTIKGKPQYKDALNKLIKRKGRWEDRMDAFHDHLGCT